MGRAGWGSWLGGRGEGVRWGGGRGGGVMLWRSENGGEREREREREGVMMESYFSVMYCCDQYFLS